VRETLRQLGSTLALPVAIGVVWMVRAEPAETPIPERATAYRVELADLPLPTPERLRRPGEGTGWRGARAIPEEPSTRQRRAALPIVSAPAPVDLAIEVPIAALEPARALARPDGKPIPSRGPVSLSDNAKGFAKPSPIVMGRAEPQGIPREKFEGFAGPTSPQPLGPATHEPFELTLDATLFEPSVQPKDLPQLPLEAAAAPKITILEHDISLPAGVIPWFAARPTAVRTIPEPGSALLFGAALVALASARRGAAISRRTGACLGGGSKPSGDSKR
jgi:hypothetical protein